MRNYYKYLCLPIFAWGSAYGAATSTENGSEELSEIVVTAEKRETNLQKTPMAIQVVSGAELDERMIMGVEGLTAVLPNVQFGSNLGQARVSLRGIGTDVVSQGNEGRIAFHEDGIYLGHPEAQLAGYYDIERIEVLYGPQGTLYGRNATGGAINIITRQPTEDLDGYLHVSAGNYDALRVEGALGGPLIAGVTGRIAFLTNDHSGYGQNIDNGTDVDDNHTKSFRGKLHFDLTSLAELTLSADYMRERDHAFGYHYFGQAGLTPGTPPLKGTLYGGVATTNGWDLAADSGPADDRSFGGAEADLHIRVGSIDIRSLTGYRTQNVHLQTEIDETTTDLGQYYLVARANTWSEELRASQSFDRGNWMAGVYYYDDRFFGGNIIAAPPAFVFPYPASLDLKQGFTVLGHLDTQAYAAFANAQYQLQDTLTAKVGVRYSSEQKTVNEVNSVDLVTPWPPTQDFNTRCRPTDLQCARQIASRTWDSFDPTATLEYNPSSSVMAYVTYSTGFKSGGYNVGNAQPPYNPERITAYEGGFKSMWWDGRLRANASIFLYKYKDLQLSRNNGTIVQVVNAAAATVRGSELTITALPTKDLQLDLNVGLLDGKYDSFVTVDAARPSLGPVNLAGEYLTQAPRYTVNLGLEYRLPVTTGDLKFRAEEKFIDRVYFTPFDLANQSQAAYTKTNMFLRYKPHNERWVASCFVRNLEDRRIKTNTNVSTGLLGYPILGSLEAPRTYGAQIGYDF
jgi:iron complex outermembrane receptor protein